MNVGSHVDKPQQFETTILSLFRELTFDHEIYQTWLGSPLQKRNTQANVYGIFTQPSYGTDNVK